MIVIIVVVVVVVMQMIHTGDMHRCGFDWDLVVIVVNVKGTRLLKVSRQRLLEGMKTSFNASCALLCVFGV